MRIGIVLGTLVVLAASLAGCGEDAAVLAPDSAPAAPQGLILATAADGFTLQWQANSEADLAGYHVYRAPCGSSQPAQRVSAGLVTEARYRVPAEPGVWQYHVCAVDRGDNMSAASACVRVIVPGSPSVDEPVVVGKR